MAPNTKTVRYRILALDGGGIRGVLMISLLKRLEEACPGFIRNIDLVAGTSTGGILALAIAAGKSLDEALNLYKEKGKLVFKDSALDDIRDMGNAIGAQYSNDGLKQELAEEFKTMKLGNLEKKVVIVSFDLDNEAVGLTVTRSWKPKIFHNFPGKGSDESESVVDVALRTSAAPTYFPVFQGYIDGGVVANNPSMCALAQALDKDTGGQSLSKVVLLSISTGGYPRFLKTKNADWGWTQWARPLIDIMLEGGVGITDYQCERIIGKTHYHRIAPRLTRSIPLDSLESIDELEKVGKAYDLNASIAFVQKFFGEGKSYEQPYPNALP